MLFPWFTIATILFFIQNHVPKPFEPQDTTDSKLKALELFCFEHILLYRVHQRIQKLQTQVLTTYEILTYGMFLIHSLIFMYGTGCIYRVCSVKKKKYYAQYCVPHSLRTACAKWHNERISLIYSRMRSTMRSISQNPHRSSHNVQYMQPQETDI